MDGSLHEYPIEASLPSQIDHAVCLPGMRAPLEIHLPSAGAADLWGASGGDAEFAADVATPSPVPVTAAESLSEFASDAFWRHFSFVSRLGSGSFGDAYLVHHVSRPHVLLVVKIPRGLGERAAQSRVMLASEATRLRELFHPGIVQFHDFVSAPPPSTQAYLVMAYAEGGSLADWVRCREAAGQQGRLSDGEISRVIYGLLRALEYLHLKGVLHLDVKPGNVLLTASGDPLLADFGLARSAAVDGSEADTWGGTRPYMAPEVLARQPSYDGRADVWSAGVLLHWLITGTTKGVRADAAGPVWDLPPRPLLANSALWALLGRMLVVDGASRPSTAELLLTPEAAAVIELATVTVPLPGSEGAHPGPRRGTHAFLPLEALTERLTTCHARPGFARLVSPFDGGSYEAADVPAIPLRMRGRERCREAAVAAGGAAASVGESSPAPAFTPSIGETPVTALLDTDRVHIVSGAAGCGKTWMLRHIAHCHATGARYDSSDPTSFHEIKRVVLLRLRDLVPRGMCDWTTAAEGIARAIAQPEAYDIDPSLYDSKKRYLL